MGVLRLGKTSITFKIKVEALEQSCDPEDAVTTPLGRFDLVVQAFHETTTKMVNKVIDDFVQLVIERFQELIKTGKGTASDLILSFEQSLFTFFPNQSHLKYGGEFFPESVSQLQLRRVLE